MGGKAFNDTSPVTLDLYREVMPKLEEELKKMGVTRIRPIGSSGKKAVTGDIDLAVECPEGRDVLQQRIMQRWTTRKFGANQISVRFEHNDKVIQVDVMVGDINWLSWARFSPCCSMAKGAARNLLINSILQMRSEGDDLDRKRLTIDWDRGLYETVQTRRGASGNVLSSWKTVRSSLITSEPDQVVKRVFGTLFKASDILRYEDAVEALKHSTPTALEIIKVFLDEALNVQRLSQLFGGTDAVAHARSVLG